MRPTGKADLGLLLLIAAAAAGVWLLFLFSPVYLDNLNVKDSVASAYAEVNLGRTDDQIRGRMLEELNSAKVGTHREQNSFGEMVTAPGLGLTAENITIDRNDVTRMVVIRVDYEREVRLTPLAKVVKVKFSPEKKGPMGQ